MEKLKLEEQIYRLKPTKKFPKGERVRKAVKNEAPAGCIRVASVRDGRMFWVDENELTKE